MARPRTAWAPALLVLVLAAGPAGRAEEPAPEVEELLPARIRVDPTGRATAALEEVLDALDAEAWPEAGEALVRLREAHGDALVLASPASAGPTPLHLPVPRVLEDLVVRFPPEEKRRLLSVFEGRADELLREARSGGPGTLETLAREWAITPAGVAALRLLARRDLEAGRFARAAHWAERWLALTTDAGVQERAQVLLLLVDARAGLGDEAGLAALPSRYPRAATVPVQTARERVPPRLRALKARSRLRAAAVQGRAPAPGEGVLPRDPVPLWARDLDTAGRIGRGWLGSNQHVLAGAAADGDEVYLHDGTVLRRLDAWTGREAWRFPRTDPAVWRYDLELRHRSESLPRRQPVLTATRVLTVLGDPVATGGYVVDGAEHQTDTDGHETRTRLAALDRRTGRLLWSTGRAVDAHPVLGDPATGCTSPPLVQGGRVYAGFARVRGAVEHYLACLDLETGRPIWVTFLALGASGRETQAPSDRRFILERTAAAPWGAPLAAYAGEVCVLPHAGFAAGVDERSGRVRWVRSLPRFDPAFGIPSEDGHDARNAPVAYRGSWLLAPYDAPRLVAVEAGTGRWRFSTPAAAASDAPPWRCLHGVAEGPAGGPWIRVSGAAPFLLPFRDPARAEPPDPDDDDWPLGLTPGRPFDAGTRLVQCGPSGELVSRPWNVLPEGEDPVGVERSSTGHGPQHGVGSVLRAGDVWIVIGMFRVVAVADRDAVREALRRPGLSEEERVAAQAVVARTRKSPVLAAQALDAARRLSDPATEAVALRLAGEVLEGQPAEAYGPLGRALLDVGGERAHTFLAQALEGTYPLDPAAWVAFLDRWVAGGGDTLVEVQPGISVRADLVAAQHLRSLSDVRGIAAALEDRERRHAARIEAAAGGPLPGLYEALRAAVGTRAARRGREALRGRLASEGRPARAAAVAADQRLDSTSDGDSEERLTHVAGRQLEQARLLAEAGHAPRATTLLTDLRRWRWAGPERADVDRLWQTLAPPAARRPRPAADAVLDLWGDATPDAAEIRSVVVPELVGPGGDLASDRLLVARGLDVEVWSIPERRRLTRFDDAGAGWFGGSLQGVDAWLPEGGVVVVSIVAGEPADLAGLRSGDWVQAFDGERVQSASRFMHRIASSVPGRVVSARVLRRGREVLDAFRPGRRPEREGAVVRRDRLWADEEGSVLVPGRVDLAWVDPTAGTRRRLWTWDGPGVVHRVDVLHGLAVVTVRRVRADDLLVAVDPGTGEEAWRRKVSGSVRDVVATGSAVLVTVVPPSRAFVVDAFDGSVRLRVDLAKRFRRSGARTYVPAPNAVGLLGRLWWIGDDVAELRLRAANTTTGEIDHTGEGMVARGGVEPHLTADAVLVVAHGRTDVQVVATDPLTGKPAWHSEPGTSLTRDGTLQAFDADARVFTSGSTVWVVSHGGSRSLTVSTYGLNPRALGPPTPRGEVRSDLVLRRLATRFVGPGAPDNSARSYLLGARVHTDGLRLTSASIGQSQLLEGTWIGRTGETQSFTDPDWKEYGALQVRRHAPVRVGERLAVPVDRGVLLVPLLSLTPR